MRNSIRHTTPRLLLAALTLITTLLLAAPAARAECPNEAVRKESRINPAAGQPYDLGLPECRAYEVVSPLEKGSFAAEPGPVGVAVSPEGSAVGFESEGVFAGAENVDATTHTIVPYLSHRTNVGWTTEAALAPASIIGLPYAETLLLSDFTPDLSTGQVSCGRGVTENNAEGSGIRCALRRAGGSWVATPEYTASNGTTGGSGDFLGSSADLSRVFIQAQSPLLPADTISAGSGGIYEVAGVGTASPELRLVSVDNHGNQLTNGDLGPLFGDDRGAPAVQGTDYQAISESGETVFFTATPTATQMPTGEQQTVYARLHHSETIAVSNPSPSECTTCSTTAQAATYQGASADGTKVFFATTQQLTNQDTDATNDLYEYDFTSEPHVVQLSLGGPGDLTPGSGANVQGVIGTSEDGSHVYFVATGVLTSIPNSLGQVAQSGADNLYGVNTNTGETKFVAALCSGTDLSGAWADTSCPTSLSDSALWEEEFAEELLDTQTTPDGRYLVFSTAAHLAPEDINDSKAAYRYDFNSGELTWLSHAVPGFTGEDENKEAVIAPQAQDRRLAGERDTNDSSRAISNSGEDVIFTTSEKLQANDTNGANDVYLWHDGTVHMISDGKAPLGVDMLEGFTSEPWAGISASGSDIFFFTQTQLVGQDTDVLQDLYDARIDGGFPAPVPAPSCTGEEWICQGKGGSESPVPPKPEGSATQPSGGNLIAAPFKEVLETKAKAKSKPLTNAQKLSAALKICKKKNAKSKRAACERVARKKYAAPKSKSKPNKK